MKNQHSSFFNHIGQYTVVYFENPNGEIEPQEVPLSWLRDNNTICMWPPKTKQIRNSIMKSIEPTENWNKYPCETDKPLLIFRKFICRFKIN